MMAPHVENRRSTVADDAGMQIQLLVEMDIWPIRLQYTEWSFVARNDIVLHTVASNFFVIWDDFKSNHKMSNQIEIKSHVF